MSTLRLLSAVLISTLLISPALIPDPVTASPVLNAVAATNLTPDEMLATFDNASLPGLAAVGDPPSITGNADLDARIRDLGEARGYQRRPEPSGELTLVDGYRLQPDAGHAWESLQAAAANAGHSITLTSAYRSANTQKYILRRNLTGTNDEAIKAVLTTVAVPGYSKHHTGYAIDIKSGSAVLHQFANSAAYAWLAADNWVNAKAHGWLPSYPDGTTAAGPNPEPWEFVWVGVTNIICGDFTATAETPFCDTTDSSFASDIRWLSDEGITNGCGPIRFCTTNNVTRGEVAAFLYRLFDKPASDSVIPFADVADNTFFTEPVRWMIGEVTTTGTSPTTFSPYDQLTRAQFVTFLWRAAGRPFVESELAFTDVDPNSYAVHAIRWASEVQITTGTSPTTFSPDATTTRGQVAAFLSRFNVAASVRHTS